MLPQIVTIIEKLESDYSTDYQFAIINAVLFAASSPEFEQQFGTGSAELVKQFAKIV